MDVIDIVREQRPDPAPMAPAARAELRARLTGEAVSVVVADEPVQHAVDPTDDGATPVRWWLSVAAILLVGACLAAVILVTTRPDAAPPVAPPPTPADPGPLYPSPTVPVVESLPDPFAIGELDGVVSLPVAPPTTERPPDVLPFAPLALSELPDGYSFGTIGFEGGEGGFGIVRYTKPGSTTQLHLTVRGFVPGFFDGERLNAVGRNLGEFAGRVVYDDGQGGGCLPDFCSVGLQWDDGSYVSISWVEPNAGDLEAWATLESLPPLVAAIAEDPDLWTERAGAVLPNADVSTPISSMPVPPLVIGELPDGYAASAATYDPRRRTAVVRYASEATATELHLIVRDDTQGVAAVEQTGRSFFPVDGIGFVLDDEGPEGCERSRCSIGWVQDDSHVSVLWVDPGGGPLAADATQAALRAIASSVTTDASFWQEFAVSATGAD